jgi:hypothetical protein
VPRRVAGRGEDVALGGDLAIEAGILIVVDPLQDVVDLGNADRTPADGGVPVIPRECWR